MSEDTMTGGEASTSTGDLTPMPSVPAPVPDPVTSGCVVEAVVAPSDLEKALKSVGSTLASGSDTIHSHYLFRSKSGSLTVETSNGRCFSRSPVIATVTGDGAFTVESWRLQSALSVTHDVIRLRSEGSKVTFEDSTKGFLEFESLDPNLFPDWEPQITVSSETASVKCDLLSAALERVKPFVSSDEDKHPNLCVAEVHQGTIHATDTVTVALVKVPGLEKCNFRLYQKTLASLSGFLSSGKGTYVSIRETETTVVFQRDDGSIFGETMSIHRFPVSGQLTLDQPDQMYGKFFVEEYLEASKYLLSTAPKGHTVLNFVPGPTSFQISVDSSSGRKRQKVSIPVSDYQSNGFEVPENGIDLSHTHLSCVLKFVSGGSVKLGFTRKKTSGWVRVVETAQVSEETITCMFTVIWLRRKAS